MGTVRVPVSKVGYRQLRRFAAAWPQATWAIEGARGLGAPLTARLTGESITVLDVESTGFGEVRDVPTCIGFGSCSG
ncbi:hypothetical protein E1264_10175 [Actinomadura sp. KC216]|uniref:hypothetical protein n=1 Tax=Actinomadura sp. KC216 TaxID=2530370 RepID=UPI00104FFF18|nr:hypothetical protein [Actinomadura sp. KC216]TDB88854.1 hypothetical protein E1264_10175 [Actinomadura sp. KC216]